MSQKYYEIKMWDEDKKKYTVKYTANLSAADKFIKEKGLRDEEAELWVTYRNNPEKQFSVRLSLHKYNYTRLHGAW